MEVREVREVRESEVAELAALTVAAYRALPGSIGPEYERDLANVAGRVATPGLLVLVALEEGRVVGGVTYVTGPGPYDEFADVAEAGFRHLAVAPGLQSAGVGTALVKACIDRARAAGKGRLALFTTDTMTAAHRVYERLGFRRVATRDWIYAGELCLLGYVLDLTGL